MSSVNWESITALCAILTILGVCFSIYIKFVVTEIITETIKDVISQMVSDYVRKDVFSLYMGDNEKRMQRLESRVFRNMSQIEDLGGHV